MKEVIKQMNTIKNRINFEKTIYYSVVLFALTLPLSRALISFFVIFLPLIWILQGDFQRKYEHIKSNKLLVAILLFLAFSALSITWTSNLSFGLKGLRLLLYFGVLFVIATSIKKEQIQTIVTAFLLGMFISEVIAYGVYFELWTFKHATVENPSPFMMHIDYSVFMAFSSVLLLNRILSSHYEFKEKLLYFFFFLTVTGNLFLALGRTGQLALIAGILVMSIIHFRLTLKSMFISILLLCIVFLSAYTLSDTFKVRIQAALNDIEKISNNNLNSSWGIRVAYGIVTYDIFKQNPLLGVGLGDYRDETISMLETQEYPYLNEASKEFMKKFHPHNQYFFILMQMGIIGLLLFLYMIYQLFKLKIEDPEIKELSILFGTVFFVSCIPEPLFAKQFTIGLFMLFVGLFSIYSTSDVQELKEKT